MYKIVVTYRRRLDIACSSHIYIVMAAMVQLVPAGIRPWPYHFWREKLASLEFQSMCNSQNSMTMPTPDIFEALSV